jgi:hypothetical protein
MKLLKRIVKWIWIGFWVVVVGTVGAESVWQSWDRYLAIVGLVSVFVLSYVAMRRGDQAREQARATWKAEKDNTPMMARYRNQMLMEARVPKHRASDGPSTAELPLPRSEHPKLADIRLNFCIGSKLPGFEVIDVAHGRN